MSEKLDIGASLRRRSADRSDARPRSDDDAGEAAWELIEPAGVRPEPESRIAAPPEPDPPEKRTASQPQTWPPPDGDDDLDEDADESPPPAFPMFPGFGDEEDEGPKGPGLDIMRFVRGLWKRKWIVIVVSVIVTGAFLALALSLPRTWSSVATLIKQTAQDEFRITGQPTFKPKEYDLFTFIDTIKLPSTLEETRRRAELDIDLMALGAAIGVDANKESDLIRIRVTWGDPETAARVANIVAEQFIENSVKIRREDISRTYDYYRQQLVDARKQLDAVLAEMVAFEKAHSISSLDSQLSVLVSQVSSLEAQVQVKTAEVGALRASLVAIEADLEKEPELIVTESRYESPLKERLSEYQWELKDAETRYTAENPKIIRLQQRIQTLERMIEEAEESSAPQTLYSLNPKVLDFQTRQRQLKDEIRLGEAQAEALSDTLGETRTQLAALTKARTTYQELADRLHNAERLEDNLSARVSEVRVVLERSETGFDMLEPAIPPTLPLPSMRKVVAAAGLVLGGGLGLFIALVLELLDPIVRTRRDVQGLTRCDLVLEFQQAPTSSAALVEHLVPTAPVSILFRRLVNDIATALESKQWRSLAITSAEPHAGRTLVAMNLASALGLKDELTLVVDADVRADAGPRPYALLGLGEPPQAGTVLEVFAGKLAPEQAFEPTSNPFVRLLNAGDHHDDSGVLLLGSRGFKDVVRKLERREPHVFYELPPLSAMESVCEAAAAVGNVMLVVRSGHTRRAALKRAVKDLQAREVEIRAVVLTMVPKSLLTTPPVFETNERPGLLPRLLRASGTRRSRGRDPLIVGDDVAA